MNTKDIPSGEVIEPSENRAPTISAQKARKIARIFDEYLGFLIARFKQNPQQENSEVFVLRTLHEWSSKKLESSRKNVQLKSIP